MDPQARVERLKSEALQAFASARTADELEQVRIAVLGKKGSLKSLQKDLFAAATSVEAKKLVGELVNPLQAELESAVAERQEALGTVPKSQGPSYDLTRPGREPRHGTLHPLTHTIREVCEIFRTMGFAIADGPEIEDEFHSFDALNIPVEHLARDPRDNFVTESGHFVRSQTSTVQIRVMQSQAPPIRCVVPGRVYRPDAVDATHHFMFHQIEGLVVDEGITFRDLKFVLAEFLRAYYAGREFEWRLRPHFFPFTECSAEVDVRMKGSSRWLEMLGCGMVDPNVFRAVGIDPDRYTGFAFGMGVERLTALKIDLPVVPRFEGEEVRGIRHFFDNDVRFLRQF